MAPPELARDAPRLDVFHPIEIGVLPVLRDELGLAVAHRGDRRLRQLLGVDVPLVGQIWLDHHVGTVAMRHDVTVRLDLLDQPLLFKPSNDCFPRRETIHALPTIFLLRRSSDELESCIEIAVDR